MSDMNAAERLVFDACEPTMLELERMVVALPGAFDENNPETEAERVLWLALGELHEWFGGMVTSAGGHASLAIGQQIISVEDHANALNRIFWRFDELFWGERHSKPAGDDPH